MKTRFEFGEISLESEPAPAAVKDPDTPFRIGVLGNFSGKSGAVEGPIGRPVLVDRDNFDEVMARIHPTLELGSGKDSLTLSFSELEDFHPDRLLRSCSMFSRLLHLREQLENPATFAAAAASLGIAAQVPARTVTTPVAVAPPTVARIASGGLLDEIVGQSTDAEEIRAPRREDELQQFVRRVVEPNVVAAADPRQGESLAMIDRALSSQMRALLHVTEFQRLEALWSAVYLLVRRLETSSQMKLYLIDISKADFEREVQSGEDLHSSRILRTLREAAPEDEPWSVMAASYTFSSSSEDLAILARMAEIGCVLKAPFLSGASPSLAGWKSIQDVEAGLEPQGPQSVRWHALRAAPESGYLGLAMPRILLRLPYGKKTSPCESFEFEEMIGTPEHEDYLWGSPALACALLLGQAFVEDGWDLRQGTHLEVENLPLHVFEKDGAPALKPCAEVLMSDEVMESILDAGLMPFISIRGRDAVRLARFQSIAEPPRRLAGRWAH